MNKIYLCFVSLFFCFLCTAQRFPVRVVGISDGDTFTALNRDNLQLKIRLSGIDAPEKKQAYGNKSKEFLSSLIFGKSIVIDIQSQDSWGRYIAYAYTPDGQDVSYLMIESGMAWHFLKYDNNSSYENAEKEACYARRGLWADSDPIAPWNYRADSRK